MRTVLRSRYLLYSAGLKVLAHYSVSSPAHAMDVNITVQSHTDTFNLGITACKQALSDTDNLSNDLLATCADLEAIYLKPVEVVEVNKPGTARPAKLQSSDEERYHARVKSHIAS